LTQSSLQIDSVSKTAAEAGALLNDNTWHQLTFSLVSISASDCRLGTDGTSFGDILLDDFKLNAGVLVELKFDEVNLRDWFDADAGSIDLDGTDDYVDAGADSSLDLTSAFTLEAWVNPDNFDALVDVMSKGVEAAFVIQFGMFIRNTGTVKLYIQSGANAAEGVETTLGLTLGEWTHIVATFDDATDTMRIFFNGVLAAESAVVTDAVASRPTESLSIGARSEGASNFSDGKISGVRVWNVAKTKGEAYSQLYLEVPGTTGLVSHWKMDDGPQSPVASGDLIIEWESKEGDRYQFQQATAAKRPAAAFGANGINSEPSVEFDGTNLLVLDSAPLQGKADLTQILAFETGSTAFSADQVVFATSDEATATNYLCVGIDSAGKCYIEVNDAATFYRATGDTVLSTSTKYVLTIRDSGSAWGIDVNGTAQTIAETGSYKGISDLAGLVNTTLGGLKHTSEVDHWEGKLPESILYNPTISDADETSIESYATSRYAV
jgi:hypothetical protein